DRLDRLPRVAMERERAAVREDVHRGPRLQDPEAASLQLHVPPDRIAEHREDVGTRRRVEARGELLRHACCADDRPELEDRRSETAPARVEPGDKVVVTASDDDCIPAVPGAARRLTSLVERSTVYRATTRRSRRVMESWCPGTRRASRRRARC